MKSTKEQVETAMKLLKTLKPGTTIYHCLKSVSSSGMSRQISFFVTNKEGIVNIDWNISHALGYSRNPKNGAIRVSGCGMDMGFSVVYSLGRRIFPDGFKLPKGRRGRNGDTSGFDNDGGYAFLSEWI